jgi:hypothetical protein
MPAARYTDRSKDALPIGLGIYGKSSIDRATGLCVPSRACVCVCVCVCVCACACVCVIKMKLD